MGLIKTGLKGTINILIGLLGLLALYSVFQVFQAAFNSFEPKILYFPLIAVPYLIIAFLLIEYISVGEK